uniref:Uncharacterized protein n=1 Tax=Salix viminalis TaxID=40686 RepID=A0A6N2MN25_SALVM
MGVSFAARKHPVLTTLRDTKAQVTPVGEVALSIPSGTKREGTGKFPLPLAGQPGRERGGNGLPKKPAPGRERTWGLGSGRSLTKRAIPFWARQNGRARAVWCPMLRPDRQLLGLPISSKLPPVFGPSCMRQKLVSRTVRRPSPTPAVMVRLRSTNTKKIQFTQRLPLGSELHMGRNVVVCEHDESLRADLLLINFPASYENGKLEHFLHRWMKNREHNNFWLTMFPEKRYFRETTSTTEVAIHTNLFTDLYASIGTGSSRTGGCLLRQLKKDKLRWYRESSVEFIIAKKEKQHPNHTQPLALKNQYPENGKWQERKGVSGDDPTFMYESQWAIKIEFQKDNSIKLVVCDVTWIRLLNSSTRMRSCSSNECGALPSFTEGLSGD